MEQKLGECKESDEVSMEFPWNAGNMMKFQWSFPWME